LKARSSKKPKGKFSFPKAQPPELLEDEKSLGEAAAFAAGIDLSSREKINKFNKLLRDDGLETHVYRIVCVGVYLVASVALLAFSFLAWHFLASPNYHWLTPEGVEKLQNFLFSGGLGAALTGIGKKFLKNDSNV
jgi:hypothetical protein